MEGAALPGRLSWRVAKVVEVVDETARVRSLVLDLPDWPGHQAGQHVDIRLTAADGYQAQRSYSIASAPEDERLVLTVERLEEGEVSPYLFDVSPSAMSSSSADPSADTSCGRRRSAAQSC